MTNLIDYSTGKDSSDDNSYWALYQKYTELLDTYHKLLRELNAARDREQKFRNGEIVI